MNKQITIRMPQNLLTKWLEALRSGKYKQGHGQLRDLKGRYCCLGVLQMATDGEVETYELAVSSTLYDSFGLPSLRWLRKHNITFASKTEGGDRNSAVPFLPTLQCTAVVANDRRRISFNKIADAVEECAEGF